MPVDHTVAQEVWERYARARDQGHTEYVRKARSCENYFAGLQWDEEIRAKLRALKRPVLTINEIFATITTVQGEQIRNRADVSFRPLKGGLSETANALDQVWRHLSIQNHYDFLESQVFDDGIITGRGFFDVRIAFDDHLRGEVRMDVVNPKNVIIDPDAEHYDPARWSEVFITKWLSPDEISHLYNPQDAQRLKQRGPREFRFGADAMDQGDRFGGEAVSADLTGRAEHNGHKRMVRLIERQVRRQIMVPHFVALKTGDTRRVPPTWDDARIGAAMEAFDLAVIKRATSVIHWTVVADDIVLFDSPSPYPHFTIVPFFPCFRRGQTVGLVEQLQSPQDLLNKTASQELHVINTTANSGWKIRRGGVYNLNVEELEARGAETGLVLELENLNDAEKILPNPIPTGLDRLTYKAREYLRSISNVSESQRGLDRADVAARAIEAKQAAGQTSLIKPFENLAYTRKLLSERVLGLVQTYYTEERLLQITGADPAAESEQIVINQATPDGQVLNDLTVGEYAVVITTVPARDFSRESQFNEAVRLKELGVPIPDEVLIENSHLARRGELIKQLREGQSTNPQASAEQHAALELELKQIEVMKARLDAEHRAAQIAYLKARALKTEADAGQTVVKTLNPDGAERDALPDNPLAPDASALLPAPPPAAFVPEGV